MQPSVIVNQSFHSSYLTNLEWKIITSGATNFKQVYWVSHISCRYIWCDSFLILLGSMFNMLWPCYWDEIIIFR